MNIARELACAFWEMDDRQQAEFFNSLADVIFEQTLTGAVSRVGPGIQWAEMCARLREPHNIKGQAVLMEMVAPLFAHTLRYLEDRGAGI